MKLTLLPAKVLFLTVLLIVLTLPLARGQQAQYFESDLGLSKSWLNGKVYEIRAIRDRRDPAQLIADYQRQWERESEARIIRETSFPWQVLTRLTSNSLEMVRVRPESDGAVGYLTRWEITQPHRLGDKAKGAVLPSCTRVINELTSQEVRRGLTSTITAHTCLESVDADREMRARLRTEGYTTEASDGTRGVIRAVRGAETLVATVGGAPKGSYVVLYITRDGP